MTPEDVEAKKRQYAKGLLRFHQAMAGPAARTGEDKQ